MDSESIKNLNWTSRLVNVTLLSSIVLSSGSFNPTLAFGQAISPEKQAHDVGVEAFEYGYPLVILGLTRTMALSGDDKGTSINRFDHRRQFFSASDHKAVRPNFDCLYSVAWLDISNEPVVVSVPDTQDRFYFLTLLDGWSEVFASVGKRTTGTLPGNFAIVGPRWKGAVPAGVSRLNSATNFAWMFAKIEAKQGADIGTVNTLQTGFKITPLSTYIKTSGGAESVENAAQPTTSASRESGRISCTNQSPAKQIVDMNAEKFFSTFSELLFSNPPHKEDAGIIAKLKSIGIDPGAEFHFDKLSPQVAASLETAVTEAKAAIDERANNISASENGWIVERKLAGVYGANYLDRAAVSKIGAGLNRLEDAVYPSCNFDSDGQQLTGSKNYILHFDKSQLPPVKAFWSLSLYDQQGFCFNNSLNRFTLSDRDALKYNGDGSLDIYLQHDTPGAEKQANWLPCPQDNFNLMLRLYFPKTTVLSGAWVPPSIKNVRVESQ